MSNIKCDDISVEYNKSVVAEDRKSSDQFGHVT